MTDRPSYANLVAETLADIDTMIRLRSSRSPAIVQMNRWREVLEAERARADKANASNKEWGRLHQAVIMERADALNALDKAEAARDEAVKERDGLQRDLAMRPSSLTTLYEIRKAMGYNEYFPLDLLARECHSARRALSDAPTPSERTLLDLAEDVMRRLKDKRPKPMLDYPSD